MDVTLNHADVDADAAHQLLLVAVDYGWAQTLGLFGCGRLGVWALKAGGGSASTQSLALSNILVEFAGTLRFWRQEGGGHASTKPPS